MKPLPRFTGTLCMAENGPGADPKMVGKAFFAILIWDYTSGDLTGHLGPYGPFDSEMIARVELKKKLIQCCEDWQKENLPEEHAEYIGSYHDMTQNGELRKKGDEQ